MADNLVMEEREEAIVSPKGLTFIRKAHFLTPSINSPVEAPPPCYLANATAKNYKDLPFKVDFHKLKYPPEKWESWVRRMRSLHHSTWEKAGIFDAIMSSTSVIRRDRSLIYGFVEKWCPVTNSFVFPWGEATVTLEDIMVLGGYSVLGDSVLVTPKDSEIKETVEELMMERSKITRTKANKADQKVWMKKFMNRGSKIEHEAFLAYWLSRFVFPINSIGRKVLSIAVHLSRGIKIALAPAVLAGIYQNMGWLKDAMSAARKVGNGGDCDGVHEVQVSAPLVLVQVWIWERFPTLRPSPNIKPNETRMAQWHNIVKAEIEDLSLKIDSAAETFEWRPYVKATDSYFHIKIYVDNEYWALVETDLNEELEELIRCLRTSELVGLEDDCIEQYLPHRVAMQFGMDQDLPGYVARENANPEIAWSNYNRPVRDKAVYVPPRLFEPGVTTRYLKWWKEIDNGLNGMATIDGKSCSEEIIVEVTEDSKRKETEINCGLNGMASVHGSSSSEELIVEVTEDSMRKETEINCGLNGMAAVDGKSSSEEIIKEVTEDSIGRETETNCCLNSTAAVDGKSSSVEIIKDVTEDSIGKEMETNCGLSGMAAIDGKSNSEDMIVEVTKHSTGKEAEDKDSVPSRSNETEVGLHGKRSFKSSEMIFIELDSIAGVSSPPGFSPKLKKMRAGSSENSKVRVEEDSVGKGTEEDLIPCTSNATQAGLHGKRSFGSSQIRFVEPDSIADVSSHTGFSPKLKKMKAGISEYSEVPVVDDSVGKRREDEYLIPCTSNGTEAGLIKAGVSGDVEVQIDAPSTGNNEVIQELKSLSKPAESEVKNTRGKEGTEQWTDIGLRLGERIRIIEKLCDLLKKGKLSCISLRSCTNER